MSPVASLDLSISNEIHWNELTNQEKAQGIHPFSLSYMKFTQGGDSPSLNEVWRFFISCRCASTKEAFTQAVSSLKDCPKAIQDLAVRISSVLIPLDISEYLGYKSVGNALERIHVKDYYKETKTFNELYKKLIEEGKADLLHPARYSELRSYLGPLIPPSDPSIDPDFITQGFITYRNFGYKQASLYSLTQEKAMLENSINKAKEELGKIGEDSSATLPSDPKELEQLLESMTTQDKHLFYVNSGDFIDDLYVNLYNQFKIACLAYEELRYLGQLDLVPNQEAELQNAEEQLVQFVAQKAVIEKIQTAKQQDVAYIHHFHPSRWLPGVHAIRAGLNAFKKYCLNQEIQNLQFFLNKLDNRVKEFTGPFPEETIGLLNKIAQIFDRIPKEATEIPAEFTAENVLLV